MTQYLSQVQGMLAEIDRALIWKIRAFVWHNKRASVAKHILYAPQNKGERALLDLAARNKAINMMWLRSYLSFGPACLL